MAVWQTWEQSAEINLGVVAAELKEVDRDLVEIDATIEGVL
ncbi:MULTISPECIES: hypothetical protein [Moorena]|uniref:Uncharacterized protein n=1 Tax=Moorena producens 3L TaxID=489825 RepID=F4XZI9_9CYAN|nr:MULTISPECIES: hypothetical protein [Moorena]EGJ29994.1 hypothetical protein LYNGBM3L_58280 [Moorena producens 3L]